MGFRDSLLRPFKKLGHRLAGGIRKSRRSGVGVIGEKVNPTGSVPRLGPHAVAEGGRGREWNGNDVEGLQRSLDPNVEVVVENGSRREGNRVDGGGTSQAIYSSPSTPSNSYGGKPNSTCASCLSYRL